MPSDFRMHADAPDHPKARRLIRTCGYEGWYSLTKLWGFATKHRPDGRLSGLSIEDVEDVAAWSGEPGKLVTALLRPLVPGASGYLDRDGDTLVLHDWASDWNRFAAGEEERREAARRAAEARWSKKRSRRSATNADTVRPASDAHADRNAGGNAPSPSPSPNPSPDREKQQAGDRIGDARATQPGRAPEPDPATVQTSAHPRSAQGRPAVPLGGIRSDPDDTLDDSDSTRANAHRWKLYVVTEHPRLEAAFTPLRVVGQYRRSRKTLWECDTREERDLAKRVLAEVGGPQLAAEVVIRIRPRTPTPEPDLDSLLALPGDLP